MTAVLDCLETPVTIITAAHGGQSNGMTAAWVTQVSFSPTLLVVSIAPERFTHNLIVCAKAFAVNVLRQGQESIAKDLGTRSGQGGDKLAAYKLRSSSTGSPLLLDAGAFYDCRLVKETTAGDHTLFIGEVVDAGILQGGPFLPFKTKEYF